MCPLKGAELAGDTAPALSQSRRRQRYLRCALLGCSSADGLGVLPGLSHGDSDSVDSGLAAHLRYVA